ncbi:melanoma-associated antigen B10-like [Carlito syrichta]|uniref:Melanoma-associated antigen B10-like n=1 Tax=Carlito syrichta TaxID=1868482 RepID=A0A1U7SZS3_CARSF|nr:melanoma-associated antigen B10-like [Carlito syrichta]
MPRGQKSKHRAREKRRQSREEPEVLEGTHVIVLDEDEYFFFPFAFFKDISQPSFVETSSNPQGPGRAPSTIITSAAVSYTRSNEGVSNQVEERSRATQDPAATENFPRNSIDMIVVLLMHYLLYKYQIKEPITKADMLRNIIQVHKSHFSEILRRASEGLELIFGLDLKEVDPYRHIYVLVSKLEPDYDEKLSDDRGVPKTGFLMTVLGVIFTKGNCATEEQVWEVLNMLDIYDGRKHFIFGEPRKLLTKDLVKEKYLEYQQVPNSDPPRYQFLWGPRAHAETSKMQVLEFLAKINDTVPSAFPSHYEEALRDEEERIQARAAARARINARASARSRAV